MDSLLTKRLITSENKDAQEITLIFELSIFNGIVSVTTNSVIWELFIRSIAGPDKTACVQKAVTLLAPLDMK